jgi:hypothetical protein
MYPSQDLCNKAPPTTFVLIAALNTKGGVQAFAASGIKVSFADVEDAGPEDSDDYLERMLAILATLHVFCHRMGATCLIHGG